MQRLFDGPPAASRRSMTDLNIDQTNLSSVSGGTPVNHNDSGGQLGQKFRNGLNDMAARAQASNHALRHGDFGGFASNAAAEIVDGGKLLATPLSWAKSVFA
ncbi:MAG TPA: hypothetical protein VLM79_28725 [Kofleriaceae bacterium]|nr:hypothetical protein [Kofleriaceae bacterium]